MRMVTARDIRRARKKLEESQAKFAKRFGVNQSTVDRWEEVGPPENGPAAILLSQFIRRVNGAGVPAE